MPIKSKKIQNKSSRSRGFGTWFIPAMLGMLLTGCDMLPTKQAATSIEKTIKPTASIEDVSIQTLSPQGIILDVAFEVNNPNAFPINLAGYGYSLHINGKQLLMGNQREKMSVAANGNSRLVVPMAINFADMTLIGREFTNRETFDYAVVMKTSLEYPVLGTLEVPASMSGELPVPRLPSVSVSRLSVAKMDLAGADVKVSLQVDNPNSFGLDIHQLNYLFSVNGAQWLQSELEGPVQLDSKQSKEIVVPVKIETAKMGAALLEMLNSNQSLKYQLSGDMTLDSSIPLLKDINLPFDVAGSVPKAK